MQLKSLNVNYNIEPKKEFDFRLQLRLDLAQPKLAIKEVVLLFVIEAEKEKACEKMSDLFFANLPPIGDPALTPHKNFQKKEVLGIRISYLDEKQIFFVAKSLISRLYNFPDSKDVITHTGDCTVVEASLISLPDLYKYFSDSDVTKDVKDVQVTYHLIYNRYPKSTKEIKDLFTEIVYYPQSFDFFLHDEKKEQLQQFSKSANG